MTDILFTEFPKISEGDLRNILQKDDRSRLELHLSLRRSSISALWPSTDPMVITRKSIIHLAIDYEATRCLEYIVERLKCESEMNIPDAEGQTPLHKIALKARAGHFSKLLQAFQLLVNKGANVNCRNNDMDTPLHILSSKKTKNGSFPQRFIDILTSSKDLDISCRNNQLEIPRIQTKKSSAVSIVDSIPFRDRNTSSEILTNLDRAIMMRDEKALATCVRMAFKHKSLKLKNHFIGSASLLYYLVELSTYDDVREALLKGLNPWIYNSDKELLPLHAALEKGDLSVTNLLIQAMKSSGTDRCKFVNLEHLTGSLLKKLLCNYNEQETVTSSMDRLGCLRRLLEPDVLLSAYEITMEGWSEANVILKRYFAGPGTRKLGKDLYVLCVM